NFYELINNEWVFNVLLLAILIFINTLFFKGLMQPKLFLGLSATDDQIYADEVHKYSNSSVTQDQIQETREKIESEIESNKPHLNPELSLEAFSNQLSLSPRIVSQTINTQFQTNFSDFINDLRIEEAKRLLKGDNNLNVLEILYEVGFNSKSAFYEHFKKKTGLTPNQFKKS
ncbi:helix-turn-helix domain-containing protein, partial [Fulvivirga lutimaris]|uniref:helix-turn-helix domain-containing protein n=1 Tax=Fulvivirga lutimaris TaxID=1819566 RepID=UPI0012BBD101